MYFDSFAKRNEMEVKILKSSYDAILNDALNIKQKYGACSNFYYAHILCPHPPFAFIAKAEDLIFEKSYSSYKQIIADPKALYMFRNQTEGIDQAILPVLKAILAQYQNEPTQPIIILHSDHSIFGAFTNIYPNIKRKHLTHDTTYGNLLALYIPDSWKKDAQNLTFINLYRFILNHLLGEHYPYIKENRQVQFELSEH